MDAIELLREDHRRIEQQFVAFQACEPTAYLTKGNIVRSVIGDLCAHAAIEEQIFYPAIRTRIPADPLKVLESIEEHHVMNQTMLELSQMTADQEFFDAKFAVLMNVVRSHVAEEETILFPIIQEGFSPLALLELGEALEAALEHAPRQPYGAPSVVQVPGRTISGAVTGPTTISGVAKNSITDRTVF